MEAAKFIELDVVDADTSAGEASSVAHLQDLEFQVAGGSGFTLVLQGLMDTGWTTIATVTAEGFTAVTARYSQVRVYTTENGSSIPTVLVSGTKVKPVKVKTLAVPSTVTTGAAVDVAGMKELTVQTVDHASTMDSTEQIQGSMDGSVWTQVGADITGPGVVALAPRLKQVRIKTSVAGTKRPTMFISGTPTG